MKSQLGAYLFSPEDNSEAKNQRCVWKASYPRIFQVPAVNPSPRIKVFGQIGAGITSQTSHGTRHSSYLKREKRRIGLDEVNNRIPSNSVIALW